MNGQDVSEAEVRAAVSTEAASKKQQAASGKQQSSKQEAAKQQAASSKREAAKQQAASSKQQQLPGAKAFEKLLRKTRTLACRKKKKNKACDM